MLAEATTAVGTENAEVVSLSAFFASTRNRSVLPTSTETSVYVFELAPLIFEQLPPVLSQRNQNRLKSVGLPLQSPLSPVSFSPSWGVPVIFGGEVFFGGFAELAAAPAPANTPRPTTSASVAPDPINPPASIQRFLIEPDIALL